MPEPGTTAECTIVNSLGGIGTLKIKKTVIGDIGGTFTFTVTPEIPTLMNPIDIVIASNANLVTNGNFDDAGAIVGVDIGASGVVGSGWNIYDSAQIPGWIVEWRDASNLCAVLPGSGSTGLLEFQNVNVGLGPAHDGQWVELDSDCNGPNGSGPDGSGAGPVQISQEIVTTEDELYDISFYFKKRPNVNTNGLDVTFGGTICKSFTNNESPSDWTQFFCLGVVGGAGTTTTLEFKDTGLGDTLGTFLDDVEVISQSSIMGMTGMEPVPAVEHTITESIPVGMDLIAVNCIDKETMADLSPVVDLNTGEVVVTVPAGVDVQCEFINAEEPEPNNPPVANDDSATTPEDTAVDIDVPDNDTDSDGTIDLTSVLITTAPINGVVTTVNPTTGVVTYTPNLSFLGTDTFVYSIADDEGATDTATVTIKVENAGACVECETKPIFTCDELFDLTNEGTDSAAALAKGFPVLVKLSGSEDYDGSSISANQLVFGSNRGNEIKTGSGNDFVCGFDGDDDINLGAGNDVAFGGNGEDDIEGEAGADFIDGGNGKDDLDGGDGNDCLFGGNGKDDIEGGNGNDILVGGDQADELEGGDGDDTLIGGNGPDDMDGDEGNDTLWGGRGADEIDGGDGVDTLKDEQAIDDVDDIEVHEFTDVNLDLPDLSCNFVAYVGGDELPVAPADGTPPVITLLGNNPLDVEINSGPYVDPGANAFDDTDGSVSVLTSDLSLVDTTTLGTYTVTFTAIDAVGNTASTFRTVNVVSAPVFTGLNVVVICGDDDCDNKKKDIPLITHLTDSGHTVTTVDDEDESWNPESALVDVVVISESVSSKNTKWLQNKAVGILTLEGATNDDLGLAAKGKSKAGGSTEMVIVDNTHPITSSFSLGSLTVTTSDEHLGMMKGWSNDVTLLGHYDGSPEKAKLLVIDVGKIQSNGNLAADKRVFYGVQFFNNLTVDGKTIFDNALAWVS